MKNLIISIIAVSLSFSSVFAKWGPAPLKSLVESSDSIVVAEFVSEDTRKIDGQRVDQDVTLRVISVIKGNAMKTVKVSGYSDPRICKAQFVFPTINTSKYLVFLRENKEKYVVVNGAFGALTITDDKVMWFTDKTKRQAMMDRKLTSLNSVIEAIEMENN